MCYGVVASLLCKRFISALGITLVGARMAEVIAEHFDNNFDAWWEALKR